MPVYERNLGAIVAIVKDSGANFHARMDVKETIWFNTLKTNRVSSKRRWMPTRAKRMDVKVVMP